MVYSDAAILAAAAKWSSSNPRGRSREREQRRKPELIMALPHDKDAGDKSQGISRRGAASTAHSRQTHKKSENGNGPEQREPEPSSAVERQGLLGVEVLLEDKPEENEEGGEILNSIERRDGDDASTLTSRSHLDDNAQEEAKSLAKDSTSSTSREHDQQTVDSKARRRVSKRDSDGTTSIATDNKSVSAKGSVHDDKSVSSRSRAGDNHSVSAKSRSGSTSSVARARRAKREGVNATARNRRENSISVTRRRRQQSKSPAQNRHTVTYMNDNVSVVRSQAKTEVRRNSSPRRFFRNRRTQSLRKRSTSREGRSTSGRSKQNRRRSLSRSRSLDKNEPLVITSLVEKQEYATGLNIVEPHSSSGGSVHNLDKGDAESHYSASSKKSKTSVSSRRSKASGSPHRRPSPRRIWSGRHSPNPRQRSASSGRHSPASRVERTKSQSPRRSRTGTPLLGFSPKTRWRNLQLIE